MKRKIWSVVLCAFMISALVGCGCTSTSDSGTVSGGNAASSVSLVLWGAADDQAMLREMTEGFRSQYPDKNINIEVRVNGEDVAKDEALKDIDTTADVFAITNDQLGALVNANAVYENTKYAETIKSTRTPSAFAAAQIGGKLYGYPSSSESYFLFYDKSKLSEQDVTSLESILAKPQAAGVAKFGYNFHDAYFSSSFFMTAGCEIFGQNGQDPTKVTFNTEQGLAAAKYIASLKAKGAVDMDGDVAGSQFMAGKLAAYVCGSWKTAAYSEALGDNLGVAKLPTITINGEQRNMISFSGGKMYVVKSTTKHPLEAMALADYLTNYDNQLKRFNDRKMLPNIESLADHEKITSDPVISAEVEQFAYSIPTPSITQMSKYWDPVAAFTKDTFDGKIPESEMAARLNILVSDITAGQ